MNALLLLVISILSLALLNVLVWGLKQKRQFNSDNFNGGRVEHDLTALNAGAIGLGERLNRIEKNQKRLAERLDQLEMFSRRQSGMDDAVHLAKQGLDIEDLMEASGLSEAEASLLLTLQREQKQKAQNLQGRRQASGNRRSH